MLDQLNSMTIERKKELKKWNSLKITFQNDQSVDTRDDRCSGTSNDESFNGNDQS